MGRKESNQTNKKNKRSPVMNGPAPPEYGPGSLKMKHRSMPLDDCSQPIRLTDLNKFYDGCNYRSINRGIHFCVLKS